MPNMKLGKLFRNLQIVKSIRKRISNYPSCQEYPSRGLVSKFKAYLREYLSSLSDLLAADWKSRYRLTRELRSQKNTKANKSLLILGGGPSSQNLDSEQILYFQKKGGEIMMMNDFHLLDLAQKISPDYYVLVDPYYWNSSLGVVENYKRYKLQEYLVKSRTKIIQPARLPMLSENNPTLFINPIFVLGVSSMMNPLGLWGHPNSVSLYALALARLFGFSQILFAGLDSSTYRHFQVNELNEVYLNMDESHAYSETMKSIFPDHAQLVNEFPLNPSQATIQSVLYSESLHRQSFMKLAKEAINVGGGYYNDMSPRASLVRWANTSPPKRKTEV